MGRGIVHPLDAMGTEPWNSDLLDWLAYDFQKNGYDIKRTLRLIANSHAYQSQASSLDEGDNADYVYRGPVSKRLTAEQFVDAVWRVGNAAPAAMDASSPATRFQTVWLKSFQCPVPGYGSFTGSWTASPWRTCHRLSNVFASETTKLRNLRSRRDLEYEVIFNGERIFSGRGWKDLKAGVITSRMNPEENRLLIGAENAGSGLTQQDFLRDSSRI